MELSAFLLSLLILCVSFVVGFGGDVMQLNTENGSSLFILRLVVNGSNSWISENGSLSGEIAFGLELVDEEEEAENGSISMENVLAVGKCFSGSLWWIDKFLLE